MICKKCGASIPEGAKFCRRCGESVDNKARIKLNLPSDNKALILIVGGAVLAVVLLILIGVSISSTGASVDRAEKKEEVASEEDNNELLTDEIAEEATEETSDEIEENDENLLAENTPEGLLQRQIIRMNSADYSLPIIDVYAKNYSVGTRNDNLIWNSELFYTLEGYRNSNYYINKNQCYLLKKELINSVTNNIMDYEIYMNPNTNVPNKIVSIEYLSEGIEVTEYYYDNNKHISFIFQYKTDNYISTYATPDKDGQRFMFESDALVTWRNIQNGNAANLVIGANEAEQLKQSWAANTIRKYSDLDMVSQSSYNEAESKMLNAAYNTLNTVMDVDGVAIIKGYVYDKDEKPMCNVDIDLYAEDFKSKLIHAMTDESGMYLILVPSQNYNYNITVWSEGYNSSDICMINVSSEQIGIYQDNIYLFKTGESTGTVYLYLGDAFNIDYNNGGMYMLSNAKINLRKGINNRHGIVIYNNTSDSNGYIVLTLEPGVYTLEVNADGYETMYYTIVCNPYKENKYEFYASPKLPEGEYAIVLTWGKYPEDIDSHLFTVRGTEVDHIWYGDSTDQFSNYLDVDDTDSFGPETVTIRAFKTTDYYKYCVVDFTDCNEGNYSSYDLSNSNAMVNIYSSEGLIGTFHVPTNRPGVIWEVFEIRNGQISPIQRYYDNVANKDWWHSEK